jgi:hypothetical protein
VSTVPEAVLPVGASETQVGIGFDRVIRSDRPIRGLLPLPADEPADVGTGGITVRWHPAAAGTGAEVETPCWSGGAEALCFSVPKVARYLCTPGSIAITPLGRADPALVKALLIATALPALLWVEGAFVLHAAAVVPPEGRSALAIAGKSGSGKSRLTAALIAQGGTLIADDSVAVRWRGDCAVGSGLAGGYHLGDADVEDRPFHPAARTARYAPLGAVVILGDHPRAGPLGPAEATGLLLAQRHRANVPRHLGSEPRALADAVRLARAAPVYKWGRNDADAMLDRKIRGDIMRMGEG